MLSRGAWLSAALFAVGCSSLLDLDRFQAGDGAGGNATSGTAGGSTVSVGGSGGGSLGPTGCQNDVPWSLRLGYGPDTLEVQSLAATPDCGAVVVLRAVGDLGAIDAGFDAPGFNSASAALRILRLESNGTVRWRRLLYSTRNNGIPQVGAGSLLQGRDENNALVWELSAWGYGELCLDGGICNTANDARFGVLVRLQDDPEATAQPVESIDAAANGATDEFVGVRITDSEREVLTGSFSGTINFPATTSVQLDSGGFGRHGFVAVLDEDPMNRGSTRARGFISGPDVRVQSAFLSGDDLYLVGDFHTQGSFGNIMFATQGAGTVDGSRSVFVVKLNIGGEQPTWGGQSHVVEMTNGKAWVHGAVLNSSALRVVLAMDGTPANTADYPNIQGRQLVVVDYDPNSLTPNQVNVYDNGASFLAADFPSAGVVGPKLFQEGNATWLAGAFSSTFDVGASPMSSDDSDEDAFLITLDSDGEAAGFAKFYQDPTGDEAVEAVSGDGPVVYAAISFSGTELDLGANLIEPFEGGRRGPNPGRYILIDKLVLPGR